MRSVRAFDSSCVALGLSVGMVFVNGCNSQMKDLEPQSHPAVPHHGVGEPVAGGPVAVGSAQAASSTRPTPPAGSRSRRSGRRSPPWKKDIAEKEALIKSMQDKLMGISPLPVELNTALEEFAKGSDLVEYDASRGLVKFKSDLLFEKGSDDVTTHGRRGGQDPVRHSQRRTGQAVPHHRGRPHRRHAHPEAADAGRASDEPALSCHRAIAVVELMEKSGIEPTRLSTRGFGEYRPLEPNAPANRAIPRTAASRSTSCRRAHNGPAVRCDVGVTDVRV